MEDRHLFTQRSKRQLQIIARFGPRKPPWAKPVKKKHHLEVWGLKKGLEEPSDKSFWAATFEGLVQDLGLGQTSPSSLTLNLQPCQVQGLCSKTLTQEHVLTTYLALEPLPYIGLCFLCVWWWWWFSYLLILEGGGRENTLNMTCCSTYLYTYRLLLVHALTRDRMHNLGILGRYSSQLNYGL